MIPFAFILALYVLLIVILLHTYTVPLLVYRVWLHHDGLLLVLGSINRLCLSVESLYDVRWDFYIKLDLFFSQNRWMVEGQTWHFVRVKFWIFLMLL